MSTRKRGLGRGLDALLGHAPAEGAQAPEPAVPSDIPIDLVVRGHQRKAGRADQDGVVKKVIAKLGDSLEVDQVILEFG